MDLERIGSYIAGKRKTLDLTQRELAEKLGVSDKSVSKWERGVCLPDVSLYTELCSALGITINEFIAGEDILGEDISRKADDNIVLVTEDGNTKRKKLKTLAVILTVLLVIGAVAAGTVISKQRRPKPINYIVSYDPESPEMRTIETIMGNSGCAMMKYETDDSLKQVEIWKYEFEKGMLQSSERVASVYSEGFSSNVSGVIAFISELSDEDIKVIISGKGTIRGNIDVLEDKLKSGEYARGVMSIPSSSLIYISYEDEIPVYVMYFGRDGISAAPPENIMGDKEALNRNDYTVLFTVKFLKEAY